MVNRNWIRRWGPVLLGAIAIWILSTEIFSDEHTGRVIVPVLHWLFPWMSPRMLHRGHTAIRKLAHVTVYFGFGVVLLRAIRGDRKGWEWWWAFAAIALAAGYAALDEIHQAFTPTRHPSVRDVMLDVCGALAAQLVLYTHERWREKTARA
jgi:VanZ family protein